jgi:hypothetical protein
MFGVETGLIPNIAATGHTGNQIRGFGFLHDGSIDTMGSFLRAAAFIFPTDQDRDEVEQFMFEFDTGLAPIVGQQATLTAGIAAPSDLIARADAGECDLIARGVPDPTLGTREKGYWYHRNGSDPAPLFEPDDAGAKLIPDQLQQAVASSGWLTYTCGPPGTGRRTGIDRDCDSTKDGVDTSNDASPQYPKGLCP